MGGWQSVNDCKRGVGRWSDHCKRLQTVNVVFSMQMTVFVMIVAFIGLQKRLRIVTLKLTKNITLYEAKSCQKMRAFQSPHSDE